MGMSIIAFKIMRCRRFSYILIAIQLAVCFSILTYTVCAFLQQFNVIITANGANKGYLRLCINRNFSTNQAPDFEIPSYLETYNNFCKQNNIEPGTPFTEEQEEAYRIYDSEVINSIYDNHNYKGKYLHHDFFTELEKSGYISEIVSFFSSYGEFKCVDTGKNSSINCMFMDEKMYKKFNFNTERGVDLEEYKTDCSNYFYCIMYPDIAPTKKEDEKEIITEYDIGDVLIQKVYNFKKHCTEEFYFEIVDKFVIPSYVLPCDEGKNYGEWNIDTLNSFKGSFLSEQKIYDNGSLIAITPKEFNRLDYWLDYYNAYTMIAPVENISTKEYSALLDIIYGNGFIAVDLDEAESNTMNKIWDFVANNCFVLAFCFIAVLFSVISVSFLSGTRLKREYALLMLCGADRKQLKVITAIKWLYVFLPSCTWGIIVVATYSMMLGKAVRFVTQSVMMSVILFALLYLISFTLSYKASTRNYISELVEQNDKI